MKCIRCGIQKSGKDEHFVCDDCIEFSKIVQEMYTEIDDKMTNSAVIDPDTDKFLQLISDGTFITASNPQTSIFYKICEYIIQRAYKGASEITEEELNKSIKTTRSWGEVFKLFEELGLINVRVEEYQRILQLTDKTKNLARQYDSGNPLSEQVIKRLAHIYSGYILLYIMYKISLLEDLDGEFDLPYNEKPKTLWNVLMFLWGAAYKGEEGFSEDDFIKFVSKRRIPSTTRGEILKALQAMSGRSVQGLIKEIVVNDNKISFKFEDYVLLEMRRIRDNRERTR